MEDGLGVIRVLNVLGDAENISAFANVVLDILIVALVSELGHLDFFRGKLFVEIEEVKGRGRQIFDAR